ncbi:hypothetical protein D3C72_2053430 [compost metagenome]
MRTRRPKIRIGAITNGKVTTTILVSLGLVINSRTIPPMTINRLRKNSDSEEPMTDCSSVVSAVNRDWISELRLSS